MIKITKLHKEQNGIASIIIVTAVISVIILIVTGFAGIIRREQRQALDQQLSVQARYAAESVINDIIADFRNDPTYALLQDVSEGCQDNYVGETFPDAGADQIYTTCVIVNPTPSVLAYDEISTNDSTLIWLDPGFQAVDKLIITWEKPLPGGGECLTSNYDELPTNINGDQVGMIRFDLTKVKGPSPLDVFTRDGLRKSNFGGVLYPRQGGTASADYSTDSNDNPAVFGTCGGDDSPEIVSTKMKAHAIIDVPNNQDRYILRLQGIYKGSQVKVIGTAWSPISGVGDSEPITFSDNQLSIEATVRVGDIVQRVQVRVSAGSPPSDILPDAAVHSTGGVCKLTVVYQGSSLPNYCPGSSLPPSP
jgi:hypothetical protein